MPKIPTYQPRVSAPGPSRVPALQPTQAGAESLAKVFIIRGRQLQEQYDTATARVAFNAFRDESRSKLSELVQFKGNEAIGVQDEYNRWYKDSINKIGKEYIKNAKQHEMFNAWSNQSRQTHLNKLADHEIKEFNNFKTQDINNELVSVEEDVRGIVREFYNNPNMTDDERFVGVDDRIDKLLGLYDTYFPGQIDEGKKQQWVESIRTIQIEELIDLDPAVAKKYLEKYKAELGGSYLTLKKIMKKALKTQTIETELTDLQGEFGSNYEAMYSYVQENGEKYGELRPQLESRINTWRQTRDSIDSSRRLRHERYLKDNARDFIRSWIDPEEPNQDLDKLVIEQKIDPEWAIRFKNSKAAEGAIDDDMAVIVELNDTIIRNASTNPEKAIDAIDEALMNGDITRDTHAKMRKSVIKRGVDFGAQMVNTFMSPGEIYDDLFIAEKRASAKRDYYLAIGRGESPMQAARSVRTKYKAVLDDVKRQVGDINQLPQPDFVDGDKNQIITYERAKIEAAKAFQRYVASDGEEGISREEYMANIDKADAIIRALKYQISEEIAEKEAKEQSERFGVD